MLTNWQRYKDTNWQRQFWEEREKTTQEDETKTGQKIQRHKDKKTKWHTSRHNRTMKKTQRGKEKKTKTQRQRKTQRNMTKNNIMTHKKTQRDMRKDGKTKRRKDITQYSESVQTNSMNDWTNTNIVLVYVFHNTNTSLDPSLSAYEVTWIHFLSVHALYCTLLQDQSVRINDGKYHVIRWSYLTLSSSQSLLITFDAVDSTSFFCFNQRFGHIYDYIHD